MSAVAQPAVTQSGISMSRQLRKIMDFELKEGTESRYSKPIRDFIEHLPFLFLGRVLSMVTVNVRGPQKEEKYVPLNMLLREFFPLNELNCWCNSC